MPVVAFDDTETGLCEANAVINAISFQSVSNNVVSYGQVYNGPNYMILDPHLIAQIPSSKKTIDDVKKILIAFGGSDTHNVTERVIPYFEDLPRPLKITVLLGPASRPDQKIVNIIGGSKHDFKIVQSPDSVVDIFLETDLALCAGGIMIYELAALGRPVAAMATEPHEVDNVKFWAKAGFAYDLGRHDELERSVFIETISQLINDSDQLNSMASQGRLAVDGKGLERCMAIITGLAA